jgi:tRNA (guanine37-N1)-methyltransferase
MRIDIITIFPEIFAPFLRCGVLGRAVADGLINVQLTDLRDYTSDPHRSVDDEPYGGGGGMVMTAPPWLAAVRALSRGATPWRVLLSPQGQRLDWRKVQQLAGRRHLLFLCGRYEGLDERVRQMVVDEEISIGDYVLSGGEVAAMAVIESLSREIPGVVGLASSVEQDSFRDGLLDFPHYTRPSDVEGNKVPEVLLSGHHREIAEWRLAQAIEATRRKRPDMLAERACEEAAEEK